jgi:PIN domain nuclease of toxin-antitoxin system
MNILLDTHVFIWYFQGSDKIGSRILEMLENPDNNLHLSIASLWEIAIKTGLEKLSLDVPFSDLQPILEQLLIRVLPITFQDTEHYQRLTLYHRDPFDRILVSQETNHNLNLVSADTVFDAYPIRRVWE